MRDPEFRQRVDALELIEIHSEWAGNAEVTAYRCEVDQARNVSFVLLDAARAAR